LQKTGVSGIFGDIILSLKLRTPPYDQP